MQIVLDMGSGNTCQNKKEVVHRMINRLFWVDNQRHDIVLKWQLFNEPIDDNVPLDHNVFDFAYKYAGKLGYRTTSSVFDMESLVFLLKYDIPFVKFSCDTDLNMFMDNIPSDMLIYKSIRGMCHVRGNTVFLTCVPKYPAQLVDYDMLLNGRKGGYGFFISDHTSNWVLFYKYKPVIYECHYKLLDSIGLDSGVFARTPDMLRRIIG